MRHFLWCQSVQAVQYCLFPALPFILVFVRVQMDRCMSVRLWGNPCDAFWMIKGKFFLLRFRGRLNAGPGFFSRKISIIVLQLFSRVPISDLYFFPMAWLVGGEGWVFKLRWSTRLQLGFSLAFVDQRMCLMLLVLLGHTGHIVSVDGFEYFLDGISRPLVGVRLF